ncbi:MAG: hypothetical protein KGD64_08250 [Candidatus Heimdallarchaeota archaeon]|nr:hypothetical protein [Candidatus Heimdallarchaeota archaeon]
MGLSIEDGKGSGFQAEVDSDNKLHTHAVTESIEHQANSAGNAYNIVFSQISDTTSSCILYVKNGFEEDIVFEVITLRTSLDDVITIKINDIGIPISGSTISPAQLNAGSNKQAEGTFQVGNNITGLSGGTTVARYTIKGDESSKHYNFDQHIFIPKNRVLTVYSRNGSIEVDGILSFFKQTLV